MSQDRGDLARHRAYGVRCPKRGFGRLDSSPDKGGHRRGFIVVEVLQGKVSVWLREESTNTFGQKGPPIPSIVKPSGVMTRNRDWPERIDAIQ